MENRIIKADIFKVKKVHKIYYLSQSSQISLNIQKISNKYFISVRQSTIIQA